MIFQDVAGSRFSKFPHKYFMMVVGSVAFGSRFIILIMRIIGTVIVINDHSLLIFIALDYILRIDDINTLHMGTRPDEFAQEFEEAYSKAENRMIREFTIKYCKEDGSIDWDTLIKFNSGD